jgi:prepilin-type N-terminal cleavage/methylation domain-containing protein
MKKGFTLLELLIVIIIVGVLATLGLTQYNTVVERSRGSEAKQILGQLRSACAGYWMESNNASACECASGGQNANMSLDPNTGVPSTCRASHYFAYTITREADDRAWINATRCKANGKTPDYSAAGTPWIALYVNFTNGTAVSSNSGIY